MDSVRTLDYFDLFKESITPYSMLDLTKIKPSGISTPKELEKEGKSICEILKDVKSKMIWTLINYYC